PGTAVLTTGHVQHQHLGGAQVRVLLRQLLEDPVRAALADRLEHERQHRPVRADRSDLSLPAKQVVHQSAHPGGPLLRRDSVISGASSTWLSLASANGRTVAAHRSHGEEITSCTPNAARIGTSPLLCRWPAGVSGRVSSPSVQAERFFARPCRTTSSVQVRSMSSSNMSISTPYGSVSSARVSILAALRASTHRASSTSCLEHSLIFPRARSAPAAGPSGSTGVAAQ